jgi:hypothetical protein
MGAAVGPGARGERDLGHVRDKSGNEDHLLIGLGLGACE